MKRKVETTKELLEIPQQEEDIEMVHIEQKSKGKKRFATGDPDKDVQTKIIEGNIEGRVKQYSSVNKKAKLHTETRKISVPAHRYTPLKDKWSHIHMPIVNHLKLRIRFNMRMRCIEIGTTSETPDITYLQKAADFVKAFIYGFEVEDALALLRLEDLFIESFDIQDVRQQIKGDHESRAIGRLAGKGGRTKFTIENTTKTRIVLADSKVHILGSFQNIQLARRAICNLILGSPPSKVYGQLRNVAARVSEQL